MSKHSTRVWLITTQEFPLKQHTPEFRSEAIKLDEHISVTAAARVLSRYESQLYVWGNKLKNAHSSSEHGQEMFVGIAHLKRQLAERDEGGHPPEILRYAPEMKYAVIKNHNAEFSVGCFRFVRTWHLHLHQMNHQQQCLLAYDVVVSKAITEAKQRYGVPRLADELPNYSVKTLAASLRPIQSVTALMPCWYRRIC